MFFDIGGVMNLPSKSLTKWIEKHREMVCEADYGGGYNTDSGRAYDILLNRGFCWMEPGLHTIIEETATATLICLREVEKCNCHSCETGEGW
jgi:hypothetical protein